MVIIGTESAMKTEDMVVNIHNQLDCYVLKVNEQAIYKSCHQDMVKDVYDRLVTALIQEKEVFCVEEACQYENKSEDLEKVFV